MLLVCRLQYLYIQKLVVYKSEVILSCTASVMSYMQLFSIFNVVQIKIKSFIVKKNKNLTPRPRMALNGATLQQQLTVHNTGAEPK